MAKASGGVRATRTIGRTAGVSTVPTESIPSPYTWQAEESGTTASPYTSQPGPTREATVVRPGINPATGRRYASPYTTQEEQ